MELKLCFGVLTKSVSKQIGELFGVEISLPDFDKDANAIVRVYTRGLITDAEVHKTRKRLMKKIAAYLKAHPIKDITKKG